MAETAFEVTTRTGIERDIVDSNNKGDINQVNAKLDIWPYGKDRPTPSLEAVRHMRKVAVRNAEHDTEEIPVVVDMDQA